jgi:hypothetical protein
MANQPIGSGNAQGKNNKINIAFNSRGLHDVSVNGIMPSDAYPIFRQKKRAARSTGGPKYR